MKILQNIFGGYLVQFKANKQILIQKYIIHSGNKINQRFMFTFVLYFQIHDDLEKEPDFSGSGFGPDDEDSTTDRHHSTSGHQTSYSSSSGVGGNSGGTSNTNTNRQDINNRKETTRVTEYDLGSGDGDIDHDDDEDVDRELESVVTDRSEDDDNKKKDDSDGGDDNGSDIFTIVTDPNKHDADVIEHSTDRCQFACILFVSILVCKDSKYDGIGYWIPAYLRSLNFA